MKTAKLSTLSKQAQKETKYMKTDFSTLFLVMNTELYQIDLIGGLMVRFFSAIIVLGVLFYAVNYFKVDVSIKISTKNCFLVAQVTTKSERVYSYKTKF